jgi:hypothetical protein
VSCPLLLYYVFIQVRLSWLLSKEWLFAGYRVLFRGVVEVVLDFCPIDRSSAVRSFDSRVTLRWTRE